METQRLQIPPRVRFVMAAEWLFRHWLVLWTVIFTLFNLLPILAPILMQTNNTRIANGIYGLYGNISHQWAHRSYFLFGEQVTYSPHELPLTLVGDFLQDGNALYQFRGNEQFGWKMAWSDRLFSMYGAGLLTIFVYMAIHNREGFAPLSWRWMLLLALPLILDGATHIMSESESLTGGFRWHNVWLANLTGNIFPQSFYVGDKFGSFNSLTRIITGILLGIGVMAWGLSIAETYFERNARILRQRLDNWWARQRDENNSTP